MIPGVSTHNAIWSKASLETMFTQQWLIPTQVSTWKWNWGWNCKMWTWKCAASCVSRRAN